MKRWVALLVTAIVGTAAIAIISFWLSFETLAELSELAGVPGARAKGIPLVVDGLTVVATVAAGALVGAGRVYAWSVLLLASVASIVGNAVHAVLAAHETSTAIAVCVSIVPPVALLASTHLTMLLFERGRKQRETDQVADLFSHLFADDADYVAEVGLGRKWWQVWRWAESAEVHPVAARVVAEAVVEVPVPAVVASGPVVPEVPVPADVPEVAKPRARRAARPKVASAREVPELVATG